MRTDLSIDESTVYQFEGFSLDARKHVLSGPDGSPIALMPKAFDILLYLVRNPQRLVEKDELMDQIWPDIAVEENNLTQNISALRKALGEKYRDNRFVATVPGRGYKFVPDVRAVGQSEKTTGGLPSPPEAVARTQHRVPGLWLVLLGAITIVGLGATGFLLWDRGDNSAAEQPIRSIAVLPFKPLAADHRDESLEMGMADALIAKLNDGSEINVRPLSAVRRFASLEQDPVAAGRVLGVDAVLEGSIQTDKGRTRVLSKLIRIADGRQIWAGQFDESEVDIFALQNSISERVAEALKVKLIGRHSRSMTKNVEAYQLYMKGSLHASRLILPEVQKAIAYYEQAIAIDPNFVMAYVGLEQSYRAMVLTNDGRPGDFMPKAKAAAVRAVELDDTSAEAHAALAMVAFWHDWDWIAAEKRYLRAIELDPKSAQAHFAYAHLLSNIGRHEQALAEIKTARELEPVNLVINAVEGMLFSAAGRDDEGLTILKSTAEMQPDFWLAHLFSTRIYLKNGQYAEAIAAATKAREITRGNSEATATVGYALARMGRIDEARSILLELGERSKTRYVAPYTIAQIHNGLGETDKALTLLESAYEEKDALMVFLKVEPKWDNLRAEPRFIDLMRRMNLN